jgi:hypothetical protein
MKSHGIASLSHSSQSITRGSARILLATLAAAVLFVAGQVAAQTPNAFPAQPAAGAQAQPLVSAPVPANQQASLLNPFSDSNPFANDPQSAPAQSFTAPAHTQGPHHTLGKTMAILGSVALGFGAMSFAVADEHCKRYTGICGDLRTGGLATMGAGGAVAGLGFYWDFQKPKQ